MFYCSLIAIFLLIFNIGVADVELKYFDKKTGQERRDVFFNDDDGKERIEVIKYNEDEFSEIIILTEQNRTEQNRTEQNRTEQTIGKRV